MKKLAPSAQEVVKAFQEMYPQLEAIKQSVQDAIGKHAGDAVTVHLAAHP